ncbi:MFS transporter [Rheinheimera riviphila]|uniref:MFS transporter n=1 Tax=Rheinheimera riviphila TaxID=1834037 RepID=A0A437QIX1_9GAMM|nr:MFS transporter [Rheinheimera riviphila]RVU34498.1 MFS transporter [Rheinheimera riviphila]
MSQENTAEYGPLHSFVWLAVAIHLVSLGGFMMLMPLGPDLTRSLQLPSDQIGLLTGWATLVAAGCGLLAAPWLDKANRRTVLLVCLGGKSLLLALAAQAEQLSSLYLNYLLSAALAGPLSAVLMAAVLDLTPGPQRGRAMALLGAAFPLAAILLVPLALQTAIWLSWRWSFGLFVVAGLLLCLATLKLMPSLPGHASAGLASMRQLLRQRDCQLAAALIALTMAGHFLLIPSLSAYFQFNLGFAREQISLLYAVGGVVSLLLLQFTGRLADQGYQSWLVFGCSALMASAVLAGIVWPLLSVWLFFCLLMSTSAVRSAVLMSSFSEIPAPMQRAAFMSLLGTVSNLAAGAGSVFAAAWLGNNAQQLTGFAGLGFINVLAIAGSLVIWGLYLRERQKIAAAAAQATALKEASEQPA